MKGKGREGIRRGKGEAGKQGKAQREMAVKGDLERRIWKCRWRLNKERLEEKGRKKMTVGKGWG